MPTAREGLETWVEVRNYGLILHNGDEVCVKKRRISDCKLKMRGLYWGRNEKELH